MKKSKSLFAIMAVTYILIAIASFLQRITISENILFGLSLSALFSALSDIMENNAKISISTNEFDYIIQITSDFLKEKISQNQNQCSSLINIRNVKFNIEAISKGYKKAKHPNEFIKSRHIEAAEKSV